VAVPDDDDDAGAKKYETDARAGARDMQMAAVDGFYDVNKTRPENRTHT